jgi:hypothetical protein
MKNLYTVCGFTTIDNVTKIRWSDNLKRQEKLFLTQNPTRCDLVTLPYPMDKIGSLEYIGSLDQFSNDGDQELIKRAKEERIIRKQKSEGTYVYKKRGRPKSNKPKIIKIDTSGNTLLNEILKAADITNVSV